MIYILFIFQLFLSVDKEYSDYELQNQFTTEQIDDLNKIREFFAEQVCVSDFKTCYEQTNHDSLFMMGVGIWNKVDFKEQKKLYKSISESTFNEIWMFCESTFYPSEIKAKNLCAVSNGKYQKYLTELGKSNPRIAKYAERIESFGDFSGLDFRYQEILNDNSSFDLNDPNIQLILAIHYLSINDQVNRNAHLKKRNKPRAE